MRSVRVLRLFDGCNTVEVSAETFQRFFDEPNDTWQGLQLSVMHGEDSLEIYRVDEGGLPARARSLGSGARGKPRGFLLGAGPRGSPRAPSQAEPILARSWDCGAAPFLFSSAFMLSPEDAFAVAHHFALTGETLGALGQRKLEWSDAWIAIWGDSRFGVWSDHGEMRVVAGGEEDEHLEETPLDSRVLDWDLDLAGDKPEHRGVLSLSFVSRSGIGTSDLTALRRTAHWEVLRELDVRSDEAWFAALAEQPMLALRRLVIRPSSTWAPSSLRRFLAGMELPALTWLVLPGEMVTAGLEFSSLPERACLVIDAATIASIEASSSAQNVWVRSTADDVADDALLAALLKARSGDRRTHLPLGAEDEIREAARAGGLRVW